MQLSQRTLPPGEHVLSIDCLPRSRSLRSVARSDAPRRAAFAALQQLAQLADGSPGPVQLALETIEMGDDQPVTRLGVGRGQYRLDLRDGHLQTPQPADDLRKRDLILGVVAIAVAGVDLARLQQPDLVVVAQRLDAQMGRAREVADRDAGTHARSIDPPLAGGSRRNWPLTLPSTGGRKLESVAAMAVHRNHNQGGSHEHHRNHLHGIVAEHVAAVNAQNEDAIVATFADDAFVNDAHREFWGTDAIRRWVAKEIVGDKITLEVTEVIEHYGETIVRGRYDGDFDKTGLPDELILTNYFTVRDGKIVSLIVIRNTPAY